MNWYITKLVFRIEDTRASGMQFDEQWRIVQAPSEAEAVDKSHNIGHAESEMIIRASGSSISWNFIGVTDVFPFSGERDGAEVFSRIEQPDNPEIYLQSVNIKADRYDVSKTSEPA